MSKVALITGAGRGIGAATARELGRRGFHIVVNYRGDTVSAEKVVDEIKREGGTAELAQADVRDPEQVAALIQSRDAVDALVCNANITPPFAPLDTMTWEDFIGKVDGEMAAVFHLTKRVLEVMRGQGSGRIVYVSSLSAELTRPGALAHATAKAALDTFARHVAAEAGPYGVGVNVVAPGAVRTDATAHTTTPEVEKARAERSVLHRMLEPEDVAKVIAAAVGGDFQATTGIRIPVDGGFRVLSAS
ncbi:SDR family oxidoreductase [Streptosporangium sp. NPDC005286]|uniref:SDR family oxidoreductase n=1 Tax=Streptosporangium sp. NPDC005286 TaxID=3154463 RepID=UPI0033A9C083